MYRQFGDQRGLRDAVMATRQISHQGTGRGLVLLDEREGEGVDELGDDLGGLGCGVVEAVLVLAAGDERGLAGKEDRGQVLADEVEGLEEQPLPGQGSRHESEVDHRPGEVGSGAALEQGAVEVEERGAGHGLTLVGRAGATRRHFLHGL